MYNLLLDIKSKLETLLDMPIVFNLDQLDSHFNGKYLIIPNITQGEPYTFGKKATDVNLTMYLYTADISIKYLNYMDALNEFFKYYSYDGARLTANATTTNIEAELLSKEINEIAEYRLNINLTLSVRRG